MKGCFVLLAILFLLLALLLAIGAIAAFVMARRRGAADRQASPVQPPAPAPSPAPPRTNPLPQAQAPDATAVVPIPSPKGNGRIVFITGPLSGRSFEVSPDGFWIGRDPSAQLTIPSDGVSKHHLWIGVRDGRVVAVDNGSTNGTFVGDRRGERITEWELHDGDVLVVAADAAQFRYEK